MASRRKPRVPTKDKIKVKVAPPVRTVAKGHTPGNHKKGNILDAGNSAGFRHILKPGE